MLFDKGFAPLGELKSRLGITDTVDDVLLDEILRGTASTIERIAGRTLRRDHGRTEIHSGGSRTIRLAVDPVAKIHEVRESSDRDFEDSTKYTSLVEGTDFVLESGSGGGRPGDSAILRRINANWLGDELNNAGQIRVSYTAGYKTDDEIDLESSTVTINSPTNIVDLAYTQLTSTFYIVGNSSDIQIQNINEIPFPTRYFIRFDTSGLLFPIWSILSVDFYVTVTLVAGPPATFRSFVMSLDPMLGQPSLAWSDIESTGNAVTFSSDETVTDTLKTNYIKGFTSEAAFDNVSRTLRSGHISFSIKSITASRTFHIEAIESTIDADRPKLVVEHQRGDTNQFNVPGDLRHANLLQAVNEFQMRKSPGMMAMAQRGTTIASGSSFLKRPSSVLPEVMSIASRYRRFY